MINLMLGDCLERMKEIPKGSVDLAVVDPPYKMTNSGKSCRPAYMPAVSNSNIFQGDLPSYDWFNLLYDAMAEGSHVYVFTNVQSLQEYLNRSQAAGFKLHNVLTMVKDTKMPNRWYLKYTELVLFLRKGAAKPINDMTSRDYMNVVMPTLSNGKVHPTQKPLDLIEKFITNSSMEGQIVLDPFMGSGTTGVACVNTGRKFIGIEMDEKYFEIAKKRIEDAATSI